MNNVSLIGRLTKEVENRVTGTGVAVATMFLAVDGFKKGEVDFIEVTTWNKTAEFCSKYFQKGVRVGVTGRISTGSYEKEGTKVYTTKVTANSVYFADGNTSKTNTSTNAGTEITTGFESIDDGDGDLPF